MPTFPLSKSIQILNELPWFEDMYFATKTEAEDSLVKHESKIFYVADQASPWSVYDGDGNVVPFTGDLSAIQEQISTLAGKDVKNIAFDDGTRTLTVTLNDDSTKTVVIPGGETTGTLTRDITAYGVADTLGISNGETFNTGLTFTDWLEDFVQRIIHPDYYAPSLQTRLNGSAAAITVEYGTVLAPVILPVFTQADAGAAGEVRYYRAGTLIHTGTTAGHTDSGGVAIGEETIVYNAELDYAEGATKDNNVPEPDPVGKILAGTISDSNSVYGKYRLFAIAEASTPADLAAAIRANNLIGTKYKGTGSYSLDVSAAKYIAIACPPGVTLNTTATINTGSFEKVFQGISPVEVTVSCAGAAQATYNVYVKETALAWPSDTEFSIQLN